MQQKLSITETLRKAVVDSLDSGMTFKGLERESGVVRQTLMKFARGERFMRGDQLDKLAEYFGLELQPVKQTRRKAK